MRKCRDTPSGRRSRHECGHCNQVGHPFASLNELRAANDLLLARAEGDENSLHSVDDKAIEDFTARAAATGANIHGARDRRTAQGMITFWAAELIRRSKNGAALTVPRLADASSESIESTASQPESTSSTTPTWHAATGDLGKRAPMDGEQGRGLAAAWGRPARSREVHGRGRGHPSPRRRQPERRAASHGSAAICAGLICATLAVVCVVLFLLWQKSQDAEAAATAARGTRPKIRTARERRGREGQDVGTGGTTGGTGREDGRAGSQEANQALQNTLTEVAERSRGQQRELDQLQAALKDVAQIVRRERAKGNIAAGEIPDALQPFIEGPDEQQAADVRPLPAVSPWSKATTRTFCSWHSGCRRQRKACAAASTSRCRSSPGPRSPRPMRTAAPLITSFSIVMNRVRRLPIFAAINMQRSAVIPLLRAGLPFRLDPRVAPGEVDPKWYAGNHFDRGHLVNAREIAWGPAFAADRNSVDRRSAGRAGLCNGQRHDQRHSAVRHFQSRCVERGRAICTRELQHPIRPRDDLHRPGAGRQRPGRPGRADSDDASGRSSPRGPGNAASLVVEAYVVPQYSASGEKIAERTKFVPEQYRTRIADMSVLPGWISV